MLEVGLACFGAGVVVGCVIVSIINWGVADRISRQIRATPWESSHFDPDVEVRWRDGVVESRLKPKEPQF